MNNRIKKYYCSLEGAHITVLRREPFDYRDRIHDERLYRPFHDTHNNISPYSGNGWEELS